MGVSGAGKTTVGRRLAAELGVEFLDADAFHSPQNVAKMASGRPLDDADRWPWLDALRAELDARRTLGTSTVLACSALAQRYRDRLGLVAGQDALVYLAATPELLRERLAQRSDHYMKASMLESQLAVLEVPSDAITIDAAAPLAEQIAAIRRGLGG